MNQLAVIEAKDLVAFDATSFDAFYQKVREQHWIENPDISTEASRDKIRSAAAKVAKIKREVERQADSLKAEAAQVVKTINAGKGEALQKMQELQDAIRKPLTDFEQADKDRVKAHEDKILEIEGLTEYASNDISPEEIDLRLEALGGIAQRDWQEFGNRATMAINMTRDHLTTVKSRRVKEIADAAELVRLQKIEADRLQKEREDEIARKAAEAAAQAEKEIAAKAAAEAEQKRLDEVKAREDAQRAEQNAKEQAAQAEADRKAAIAQAETDRIAAAKKAEDDRIAAEAAATKREQDRQAAETKRVADDTARREADQAHRKKINNEILEALNNLGLGLLDETRKEIVKAIAQGKIPHVAISY